MGTIKEAAGDYPSPSVTGADFDSIIVCSDDPLSPSPVMTPTGEPILICSLPESGFGSATQVPPSNEIKPTPKRSAVSRRKRRGVHLGSSDSDEDKQQSEPLLGNRILPPTIQDPTKRGNQKDSTAKVGSCSVNTVKDLSEKSEKAGSCNVNSSVKIGSCSANPPAIGNLLDVYNCLPQEHLKRIGEMDILEIAAMKGFRFEPPRWHRSGGYDSKPRNSK